MKQGEIYLANLNHSIGSEQSGVRPVLIVSGNTLNKYYNVCIVCPLTSKIKDFPASPIIRKIDTDGLERDSQIISFQIRSICKSRLIKKLGEVSSNQLKEVFTGIIESLTI